MSKQSIGVNLLLKTCTKCSQTKHRKQFAPFDRGADGRYPSCRKCQATASRLWKNSKKGLRKCPYCKKELSRSDFVNTSAICKGCQAMIATTGKKRCTKCGQVKPLSDFHKSIGNKTTGKMARCGECVNRPLRESREEVKANRPLKQCACGDTDVHGSDGCTATFNDHHLADYCPGCRRSRQHGIPDSQCLRNRYNAVAAPRARAKKVAAGTSIYDPDLFPSCHYYECTTQYAGADGTYGINRSGPPDQWICGPHNRRMQAWVKPPRGYKTEVRFRSFDVADLPQEDGGLQSLRNYLVALEIADMWENQGKECSLCGNDNFDGMALDHCHNCLLARGLICGSRGGNGKHCNAVLEGYDNDGDCLCDTSWNLEPHNPIYNRIHRYLRGTEGSPKGEQWLINS